MPQPTIIAVGELLVEFVSHRQGCELRELSDYSGPYPSGAPAICIDQAARLGAATQIYGGVGKDNFGSALIERLQANGVNTTGISQIDSKSTGVAFVSYYSDGNRTFIFHLNNTAADSFNPKQNKQGEIDLPEGPLLMHISGSSLGNPHLRSAIESTAEQVLQRGGQLSCDPNARPELMNDPAIRNVLQTLIEKSTYLFPSEVDFEYLYPEATITDTVARLLATGVETIALTRGELGVTLFTSDNGPLHLAGHAVTEVDPTGAGDCFCGTFLSMATQGRSLETSGRYANAAGALAVTKRGPMEGNSTLGEIESFINSNPANTTV